MPDVSTKEEYEGYLERLADQTHPDILADNVDLLRTEVGKFDQHLEIIDRSRHIGIRDTVKLLGGAAIGTAVGEASSFNARAALPTPDQPSPKLLLAIGLVPLGAFSVYHLAKNIRNSRHFNSEKKQRDHVESLTQKAEARLGEFS